MSHGLHAACTSHGRLHVPVPPCGLAKPAVNSSLLLNVSLVIVGKRLALRKYINNSYLNFEFRDIATFAFAREGCARDLEEMQSLKDNCLSKTLRNFTPVWNFSIMIFRLLDNYLL